MNDNSYLNKTNINEIDYKDYFNKFNAKININLSKNKLNLKENGILKNKKIVKRNEFILSNIISKKVVNKKEINNFNFKKILNNYYNHYKLNFSSINSILPSNLSSCLFKDIKSKINNFHKNKIDKDIDYVKKKESFNDLISYTNKLILKYKNIKIKLKKSKTEYQKFYNLTKIHKNILTKDESELKKDLKKNIIMNNLEDKNREQSIKNKKFSLLKTSTVLLLNNSKNKDYYKFKEYEMINQKNNFENIIKNITAIKTKIKDYKKNLNHKEKEIKQLKFMLKKTLFCIKLNIISILSKKELLLNLGVIDYFKFYYKNFKNSSLNSFVYYKDPKSLEFLISYYNLKKKLKNNFQSKKKLKFTEIKHYSEKNLKNDIIHIEIERLNKYSKEIKNNFLKYYFGNNYYGII